MEKRTEVRVWTARDGLAVVSDDWVYFRFVFGGCVLEVNGAGIEGKNEPKGP